LYVTTSMQSKRFMVIAVVSIVAKNGFYPSLKFGAMPVVRLLSVDHVSLTRMKVTGNSKPLAYYIAVLITTRKYFFFTLVKKSKNLKPTGEHQTLQRLQLAVDTNQASIL